MVNSYGQGFYNSAGYVNYYSTPVYINGNSSVGIYVGPGVNSANNKSIAIGINALSSTPSPANSDTYNTALGSEAMRYNNNGNINVALGAFALAGPSAITNNNSTQNTALGVQSMQNTTNGSYNCAVGYVSMAGNTTGYSNVAVGIRSLEGYTASNNNTAVGNYALNYSSTPTTNGIVGNCGFGSEALSKLLSGNNNVAVGYQSLKTASNFTGSNNIGIGASALSSQTAGSNNIGIGQSSQVANSAGSNQLSIQNIIYGVNNSGTGATISTGSIGIGTQGPFGYTVNTGAGDFSAGSNPSPGTARLRVNGTTWSTGFYATSDKKFKRDIKSISNSLRIINALEGKTYFWNKEVNKEMSLDDARHSGFIAQEVEKILPHLVATDANGNKAINYLELMPYLTEGIKEQQSEIETQKVKIENLELQITELKNKMSQLIPGDVKLKVNSIEVLPNPITGVATVSYKLDNSTAPASLSIYDLQGKLLKQISLQKNAKQGQIQVSKSELPAGMYIFSLVSGNEELQSKKVIVSQ